jgi:hypothetical protein
MPLSRPGNIEIELGGTVIRVTPGTDWRHLREVRRVKQDERSASIKMRMSPDA